MEITETLNWWSCSTARDSITSAIFCPQNNQKRICGWISSAKFGECDLTDQDNIRTLPKSSCSSSISHPNIHICLFCLSIQGFNESWDVGFDASKLSYWFAQNATQIDLTISLDPPPRHDDQPW
jgi:hypothetical protein